MIAGSPHSDEDDHQLSGVSPGVSPPDGQPEDWRATVRPPESVQDLQFLQ